MIATRVAFARLVLELVERVESEIPRSKRQVDRCSALALSSSVNADTRTLEGLLAVLDEDDDGCGLSFDGAATLGRWVCGRAEPSVLVAALSVMETARVLDDLDDHRWRWERGA